MVKLKINMEDKQKITNKLGREYAIHYMLCIITNKLN